MKELEKYRQIYPDTINLTGVYKLYFDQKPSYVYVGSASQVTGFFKRWQEHLGQLIRGKHYNKNISRHFVKYGNPIFEIIEITSPDKCIEREQYWIDKLDACRKGLNQRPKAGSNKGIVWSAETRKRMSLARLGKPSGRLGIPLSSQTKIKIGLKSIGRTSRTIIQMTLQKEPIKEWSSIKEAGLTFSPRGASGIRECLIGRNSQAYGYLWAYKYGKKEERQLKCGKK